ncbi:Copper Transporter integral membrane protein that functions in high affinity copper transport [Arthrobotrys musiformis]|uniref:Copper transport protein n=1 Tax=Arthrobotrys musiformis TaxID=47236 RepID=A0AAV9VZR9_9PEZI
MDHGDMNMATPTTSMDPTMTGMSASATTSSMSSMMGGCKISMLWNWYTVDSCFISRTWRVSSEGIFALSCIGVILLVISLEFVRRMQREYDRHIIRHATAATAESAGAVTGKLAEEGSPVSASPVPNQIRGFNNTSSRLARFLRPFNFRPSFLQQVVRGLLYMVQFGAAYFVMLMAMYYNGYIIICILIGAFLGFTLFGYDNLAPSGSHQETGTSCC